MSEVRVGDMVRFKADVEGRGRVLEITRKRQCYGRPDFVTVTIGNPSGDHSPWHPMARPDYTHKCSVVCVQPDQIW